MINHNPEDGNEKQQLLREEQVAQLADSLELAKTIEVQAKQLSEMIEAFAIKYERRLADVRRAAGQK
ncbi:MAG: hypothetical protein EBE86_030225 [Hormoscilla sp. GUM202]|nr:hypothetical protein [Hormoscilla sp. GM7CHS1pb]MBO1351372.1 hypothetical protein [Hormoscilla sp. GUM202]